MTNRRWTPAYVGLGSNLDGPEAQVQRAMAALAELPETRCVACSSLYRSKPLGPVAQPEFVNAAAGLLTQLGPGELLAALKSLEERLGRERPVVRWGPRRIDLDLLVYGDVRIDEPELTVPHPGIAERPFVLAPLAELAPDLDVPGAGCVGALLERIGTAGLERIAA